MLRLSEKIIPFTVHYTFFAKADTFRNEKFRRLNLLLQQEPSYYANDNNYANQEQHFAI